MSENQNVPDVAALMAQVAALQASLQAAEEAKVEALKAKEAAEAAKAATVKLKVSPKGTVHFRGLVGTHAKFGLGMYVATIRWLYANRETVEKFINDNSPPVGFKWFPGCGKLSLAKAPTVEAAGEEREAA